MIKIVCGVYGHYIDGRVVAKNSDSEPFSLTPRQEAELVAKGVAAFVDEVTEVSHAGASAPIGFDESPEPDIEIPEYSVDMKADELREIGKDCGLHFKVGMTKADMVAWTPFLRRRSTRTTPTKQRTTAWNCPTLTLPRRWNNGLQRFCLR
jgi:hypothetical protein